MKRLQKCVMMEHHFAETIIDDIWMKLLLKYTMVKSQQSEKADKVYMGENVKFQL